MTVLRDHVSFGHLLQNEEDGAWSNGEEGNKDRQETPVERPRFHVMPESGWMNDPNGPIQHNGVYHLFFQHNTGTRWSWGIDWSHAASKDLVHWQHLPVALKPTKGWYDADGCFSGCCVVGEDGIPTILYTAARRRDDKDAPAPPPSPHDLGLIFIESQCAAQPVSGEDNLLKEWKKFDKPLLPMAPGMGNTLAGWRDPFVFEKGGNGKEWGLLIGTGIENKGGSVMVYKSKSLSEGWRFDRFLCQAPSTNTGKMWECPSLVKLQPHPTSKRNLNKAFEYLLCISPDAPTNATICYLGDYVNGKFLLENAIGPFQLDLGDILYAPNSFEDSQGRRVIWGWLQEKKPPGYLTYAGCQSVPRLMWVKDLELFQEPAEEMSQLRSETFWGVTNVALTEGKNLEVGSPVTGHFLDMEIVVERGTAQFFGIQLSHFENDGEGGFISYDWNTSNLCFINQSIHSKTTGGKDEQNARVCGGLTYPNSGDPLRLRIFIDYSLIEIFTGTGKVLSTRCYRGSPAPGSDPKIEFVAVGGDVKIIRAKVFEMSSIWVKRLEDQPLPAKDEQFDQIIIMPKSKDMQGFARNDDCYWNVKRMCGLESLSCGKLLILAAVAILWFVVMWWMVW
ncbi:hypothetical protein BSKO_09984 [Bryopsis sp. KO-2023]|nr:hypothetical protein BSKO_09984 [Bryopsis sp. KO-2023]